MADVKTYQIVSVDMRQLLAQEMAARTMSVLDGLLLPDRFQEAYQRLVELFVVHTPKAP